MQSSIQVWCSHGNPRRELPLLRDHLGCDVLILQVYFLLGTSNNAGGNSGAKGNWALWHEAGLTTGSAENSYLSWLALAKPRQQSTIICPIDLVMPRLLAKAESPGPKKY
jgi:hypothetical protein